MLACPKDRGPLYYFVAEDCLYNARLQLKYEIEGNIPVLLVDKAVNCDDDEHTRLMQLAAEREITENFFSDE